MKTKIKDEQTDPLGACGTDTNPRKLYEVTVRHIDCCESKIRVRAKSEAAAEDAAVKRVARQQDWQWDTTEHDLYAFSTEEVKEGGSHV